MKRLSIESNAKTNDEFSHGCPKYVFLKHTVPDVWLDQTFLQKIRKENNHYS